MAAKGGSTKRQVLSDWLEAGDEGERGGRMDTGRFGKAGFRNCALEMTETLHVEMSVGSSR